MCETTPLVHQHTHLQINNPSSGASPPSSRSSTPMAPDAGTSPPSDQAPRPTTPLQDEASQPGGPQGAPWRGPSPPCSDSESSTICSTAAATGPDTTAGPPERPAAVSASDATVAWEQETMHVVGQMVQWLGSMEGPAAGLSRVDMGPGHALPTVQKVAAMLTGRVLC